VTGCTTLFKRQLLTEALPFPAHMPHDHWLAIAASACAGGVVYHGEALTRYRRHANNAIGAKLRAETAPPYGYGLLSPARLDDSRAARHARDYLCYTEVARRLLDRLGPRDRRTLNDVIQYHRSYFGSKLRPRALMIHLKYARYFNEGRSAIGAIRKTLSALFGEVDATCPNV